jgi:hypothetical protein
MRGLIGLGLLAFFVGLGVVVGQRMSSEAMAVVVGVVCGVSAGIPTSVLLLVVMRAQQRRSGSDQPPQAPAPQYPPVIVVGAVPQQARQDSNTVDSTWRAVDAPRRKFRVIGEE